MRTGRLLLNINDQIFVWFLYNFYGISYFIEFKICVVLIKNSLVYNTLQDACKLKKITLEVTSKL